MVFILMIILAAPQFILVESRISPISFIFALFLLFIQDNYGVKSSAASQKVKALYRELNLQKLYQDCEEESYKNILELISQKSANLPKEMFLEFVTKIYKRDK